MRRRKFSPTEKAFIIRRASRYCEYCAAPHSIDKWADHFFWSTDFTNIESRTGVGRATIEALSMNRQSLINLRKALILFGVHPPKL